MKKNKSLALFGLVIGLSWCNGATKSFIHKTEEEQNIVLNNKIKNATSTQTVTLRIMADYLQGKKAHYPLSDEFIERYQQTGDGYISYAKTLGMTVSKELHGIFAIFTFVIFKIYHHQLQSHYLSDFYFVSQ